MRRGRFLCLRDLGDGTVAAGPGPAELGNADAGGGRREGEAALLREVADGHFDEGRSCASGRKMIAGRMERTLEVPSLHGCPAGTSQPPHGCSRTETSLWRGQSAMSVAVSWSRVMSLLREHAPADHADLPGPATEQMLAAAEERMGISLHGDLRTWLLQNDLDLPEEDVDDEVACCGFDGFPDEGSFFLGIRAMERLYANRSRPGGFDPPDQPDNPFWRNEWIPFLSDQDGWMGKFIDVRDGRVGKWFVGEVTVTGEYESMAQYFDSVAEKLTQIAEGSYPVCRVAEGRLVWS